LGPSELGPLFSGPQTTVPPNPDASTDPSTAGDVARRNRQGVGRELPSGHVAQQG
jgi:hypothetical protein